MSTHEQPKTLPVPEAGRRYFGLGRNASYAAAKRGDIPTVRVGRLLRAPIVALERRHEQAGKKERGERGWEPEQTCKTKRLSGGARGAPPPPPLYSATHGARAATGAVAARSTTAAV